jgi:transcriptional regulator with XRE-family HTH domain
MEKLSPRRQLPADLGQAIRSARLARGWTIVDAARYIGMSRSMLGSLEHGRKLPSAALAADIAAVLELDPDTADRLAEVAVPDRGRSRPGAAHGGRRCHEDWPTARAWMARQSTGTAEQLDAFLRTIDRRRLQRLDDEMRVVAQALRRFVAADDALVRCEVAESIAQALDSLGGVRA